MKTKILSFLALFSLQLIKAHASVYQTKASKPYATIQKSDPKEEDILKGIQFKIQNAWKTGPKEKIITTFDQIGQALDGAYKKKAQPLILYWKAYLEFNRCAYFFDSGEREKAKKAAFAGIDVLENISYKNSEDYALLGLLKAFSIEFESMGIKKGMISAQASENGEKALKLDDQNLRAYYVLGLNDFYKPKKFGGGQEVEKLLIKAIGLPEQKLKNPYLPSWGKDECYAMLVRYYLGEKDMDSAKKIFEEGVKKYPDSDALKGIRRPLK